MDLHLKKGVTANIPGTTMARTRVVFMTAYRPQCLIFQAEDHKPLTHLLLFAQF